jgi:hypothetical protein
MYSHQPLKVEGASMTAGTTTVPQLALSVDTCSCLLALVVGAAKVARLCASRHKEM